MDLPAHAHPNNVIPNGFEVHWFSPVPQVNYRRGEEERRRVLFEEIFVGESFKTNKEIIGRRRRLRDLAAEDCRRKNVLNTCSHPESSAKHSPRVFKKHLWMPESLTRTIAAAARDSNTSVPRDLSSDTSGHLGS